MPAIMRMWESVCKTVILYNVKKKKKTGKFSDVVRGLSKIKPVNVYYTT